MSRTTVLFIASAALVLGSACGPPWTVITQSGPPSSIKGASPLTAAFDISEMTVDGTPIAEHKASKGDKAGDWDVLQSEMDANFVAGLDKRLEGVTVTAGSDAPMVTVKYLELKRGRMGPFAKPTQITARLAWTVGGAVTDEIETTVSVNPSIYRPSASQRLKVCADQLAEKAAAFYKEANGN